MDYKIKRDSGYIKAICLVFSLSCFVAAFAATIYLNLWGHVWKDFFKLLTMPSPLVTDYFKLGNLASAFLNAGMCGDDSFKSRMQTKYACRVFSRYCSLFLWLELFKHVAANFRNYSVFQGF